LTGDNYDVGEDLRELEEEMTEAASKLEFEKTALHRGSDRGFEEGGKQ